MRTDRDNLISLLREVWRKKERKGLELLVFGEQQQVMWESSSKRKRNYFRGFAISKALSFIVSLNSSNHPVGFIAHLLCNYVILSPQSQYPSRCLAENGQ